MGISIHKLLLIIVVLLTSHMSAAQLDTSLVSKVCVALNKAAALVEETNEPIGFEVVTTNQFFDGSKVVTQGNRFELLASKGLRIVIGENQEVYEGPEESITIDHASKRIILADVFDEEGQKGMLAVNQENERAVLQSANFALEESNQIIFTFSNRQDNLLRITYHFDGETIVKVVTAYTYSDRVLTNVVAYSPLKLTEEHLEKLDPEFSKSILSQNDLTHRHLKEFEVIDRRIFPKRN